MANPRRRQLLVLLWIVTWLAMPWRMPADSATLFAAEESSRTRVVSDTNASPGMLDLARAVVVLSPRATARERKAAEFLVEEVSRRTRLRWAVTSAWPTESDVLAVAVGTRASLAAAYPQTSLAPDSNLPEGFSIAVRAGQGNDGSDGNDTPERAGTSVVVAGNDERGVFFAVGRLLRELRMGRDRVQLPDTFQETSAPRFPLRGHQLGYRPKTNSYDAWDLPQWEQYYRDLVVFGANAVELVPPRTDDDADSPHFPRPPLEMMAAMSGLADEYALDVWIWFPALDKDYSDPATVEFSLREWEQVFQRLPRIDGLFVPGGDPGKTPPQLLMPLLEKQIASLRKYHPQARLWVAPQAFNAPWLEDFLEILRGEPEWLEGLVYGPQIRVSLPELRKMVPARYRIRAYPDITHTLNCQHPVPNWDLAFARTLGREPINPRPEDQAVIFGYYRDATCGFITYSEGCNDDVNKAVWSGLGWNPDTPVEEILRQYARVFVGEQQAEGFARGLSMLERNWRGPLATNTQVEPTLQHFQQLERTAAPADLLNWRFQQALYRAYYDAFVQRRLLVESAAEDDALRVLADAPAQGAQASMQKAEAILAGGATAALQRDAAAQPDPLRVRTRELAEALFQSVRMQLDTERYRGQLGRGTSQQTLDAPLNDRAWLVAQFERVRGLSTEPERLDAIRQLLHREDPGPGGFYDDLGDPSRQPHLVRGAGFAADPDFRRTPIASFDTRPGLPRAWATYTLSLYDQPQEMRYEGLDASAQYRVRVVYAPDLFPARVRLEAEGQEVHAWVDKTTNPETQVEALVPRSATADGELTLRWHREPGLGGNGRGCQVREVWLTR
jgi:hypothetical protein